MKAKFFVLDFINFVFLIILILFFLYYIILGDRIDEATRLVKTLGPLSFLGIIFFGRFKLAINEVKKKVDGDEDLKDIVYVLYLNFSDKIITEVVIFSLPVIIILLAYFNDGVNNMDIIQAGVVFAIMLSWFTFLFKKAR